MLSKRHKNAKEEIRKKVKQKLIGRRGLMGRLMERAVTVRRWGRGRKMLCKERASLLKLY